jgi:hypothetical protein
MRVVLVGNAPVTRDHGPMVDAADLVVRFNEPATWANGTGRRFDVWVIANGRAGSNLAARRPFAEAPYRDLPSEIWFPVSTEVHAELRQRFPNGFLKPASEHDTADDILSANGLGQPARHLGADNYRRAFALLRDVDPHLQPTRVPSAGFVTAVHFLESRPEAALTLVGFTFRGWPVHPWAVEEVFVRRAAEAGRLTLLPA